MRHIAFNGESGLMVGGSIVIIGGMVQRYGFKSVFAEKPVFGHLID